MGEALCHREAHAPVRRPDTRHGQVVGPIGKVEGEALALARCVYLPGDGRAAVHADSQRMAYKG